MKQPTKEVIRLRFDKLEKSLMRTVVSFDSEDIHVFRVEIKKLRAFLRLCGKSRAGKPKLPKALHVFYRVTGGIRNLQMQQQRVRETWKNKVESMPRTYLSLLSLDAADAMLSAKRFARKNMHVSRDKRSLLANIPDHISKKSIRHFALATLSGLEALPGTFGHFTDAIIHSTRKLLKDLQYNLPYEKMEMAFPLPHLPADGEAGIESLTDTLGEFQDICSSVALLQPCYLQRIPDEAERAVLRGWKAEIEIEKEQWREKIGDLLAQHVVEPTSGQLCVARNGMITYAR